MSRFTRTVLVFLILLTFSLQMIWLPSTAKAETNWYRSGYDDLPGYEDDEVIKMVLITTLISAVIIGGTVYLIQKSKKGKVGSEATVDTIQTAGNATQEERIAPTLEKKPHRSQRDARGRIIEDVEETNPPMEDTTSVGFKSDNQATPMLSAGKGYQTNIDYFFDINVLDQPEALYKKSLDADAVELRAGLTLRF